MLNNKKEYKSKDYYYELSEKKFEVVSEHVVGFTKLHFHDYLEAELILSGEAVQYINDYKTKLHRGSFTILRPNVDCHTMDTTELNVIKFYVKSFVINEEIWKEISLLLDPLVIELEGEELEHTINLFNAIKYEQNMPEKYTEEIIKNVINSLLCLFIRVKEENDKNVAVRKNIINYLIDNDKYLTEVSLQDFANDFGYSLSHASKYFKDNTGMTFSEAKQFFRIQYAKRLLLSSNYSINEISNMCGFNYYHLFNKVFKRNTKMTPLEFRKNNI